MAERAHARLDPIAYVVYPMRQAVCVSSARVPVRHVERTGGTSWLSPGMVAVMGAALPAMESTEFRHSE